MINNFDITTTADLSWIKSKKKKGKNKGKNKVDSESQSSQEEIY